MQAALINTDLCCRPRVVECLLTLRRIYEVERNDGKRSPRRPFALSPRAGTPDVSGHQPLRLAQRHASPFTPDVNYQAVQQVHALKGPLIYASVPDLVPMCDAHDAGVHGHPSCVPRPVARACV